MKPKVFIGSSREALSVVRIVEDTLSATCDVFAWDTNPVKPSQYLFEGLLEISESVDFAILILSPDDQLNHRENQYNAPRDNVIFEAGLFMSKVGRERVFLLSAEGENLKYPTDIAPIQRVSYEDLEQSLLSATQSISERINSLGVRPTTLAGKRLFEYKGYYPIELLNGRNPVFSKIIFFKAIEYFSKHRDDMAATDLVYLWEANRGHIEDRFTEDEAQQYNSFITHYNIRYFLDEFDSEHKRIFSNYIKLVNDIGDTLEGVFFEILLHDVRNPIRSIIAARNTQGISNRKVGEPSTRFVVQYVKEQGRRLLAALESGSKVAYRKQFELNKFVKATTIPIWDSKYGLVGMFCINIDINQIELLNEEGIKGFIQNYIHNTGKTPEFEGDIFI
ncbi:MAG TPA: TIR domain-containing protein [Pyrinomonadaceae bacterium]